MGLIDKVKGLPTPLFILHFTSKAVITLGLGVLLANQLDGFGWWIIGLGLVLSIPAAIKIFTK